MFSEHTLTVYLIITHINMLIIADLKYKIKTTGSGNKNEFSAWVELRGMLYEGKGQSKKDAKQDAARNALADLCDEEVQANSKYMDIYYKILFSIS